MTITSIESIPDKNNLHSSITQKLQNILGLGHLDILKLPDELLNIKLQQYPLPTMTMGSYNAPALYWQYIPCKQSQQDVNEFILLKCFDGMLDFQSLDQNQILTLTQGDILLLHTSIAYQLNAVSPVFLYTLRIDDHCLFHLFPLLIDYQPIPVIFSEKYVQFKTFKQDFQEIHQFLSITDVQENNLLECMESLLNYRLRNLLAENYLHQINTMIIPETCPSNQLDHHVQINGELFAKILLHTSQNYPNISFSMNNIAQLLKTDVSEILLTLTLLRTNFSHLIDEMRLHEGLSHLIAPHPQSKKNPAETALTPSTQQKLAKQIGFTNEEHFLMLFVEKFNLYPQTFSDLFSFYINYGKYQKD